MRYLLQPGDTVKYMGNNQVVYTVIQPALFQKFFKLMGPNSEHIDECMMEVDVAEARVIPTWAPEDFKFCRAGESEWISYSQLIRLHES